MHCTASTAANIRAEKRNAIRDGVFIESLLTFRGKRQCQNPGVAFYCRDGYSIVK
jgi:hypothetical protein